MNHSPDTPIDHHNSPFFQTLLSSIGDAVITTDIDGRVGHLNPAAESLTGWSIEEARDRPIEEVMPLVKERTGPRVGHPIRDVLQTCTSVDLTDDVFLVSRDGSQVPIEDSAVPILRDDGTMTGAIIVFRSLVERRDAERRLAEQHELAQLISDVGEAVALQTSKQAMLDRVCRALVKRIDAAFARIWTVNPVANLCELQASAGMYTHLDGGHSRVPVGHLKIGRIAASQQPHLTNHVIGDPIIDQTWAKREGMVAFAGYPLIIDGETVGVMGLFARHELSERTLAAMEAISKIIGGSIVRHRLQRSRKVSERRFRELLDQVSDYAIFMTDKDRRATTWHEGVRQVLGYDEHEFIGLDVASAIFTESDMAKGVPEWVFNTAIESGSCTDDRWMQRKDGTSFWASGITTRLDDVDGNLIGFNKIMRDLTHRKDTEDAIRQLNAELSTTNRQKNEFLAMLAHELRNPLSPITSAIELMKDVDAGSHDLEELRELVARQVQLMVRLVDDLLDLSRISRGTIHLQRTQCRLQPIIRQAIEAAQPFIADSSHECSFAIPDAPIFLNADPIRLAQVVTNLLNNAAKYTPLGGRIGLSVAVSNDQVMIRIADNGVGIEKEKLETVFELFTQADVSLERGKSGLGIGLALVKTLVELHEGSIAIVSEGRNCGTEVTVTLPTIEVDHVDRRDDSPRGNGDLRSCAAKHEAHDAMAGQRKPRRVLVVDDVHAITFTLSRLIKKLGHEVETAGSGREALDIVLGFVPEIVFSDISMPEMNGYELAAELRRRQGDRQLRIVAMTGFGQEADRQRALDAGFDDHMIKPPDIGQLSLFFDALD